MSCGCTDLNDLVNQANSIVGGCYPTPIFASGGSYAGVLLTGSTFTVGTITSSAISGSAITGSSVTGLPAPTVSSDAATKAYADALAFQGFDVHAAVDAATTANLTLEGAAPSTLDGRTLLINDRILVKDQTDNRQNGIYYVATVGSGSNGTWTRAADADATGELKVGAQTYVKYGTVNGGSLWVLSNATPPTIGASSINFTVAYSFFALPAAKITGQVTNSQISSLAANKLTGNLISPYLGGTLYNRVEISPDFGFKVGDVSTVNGAIYVGRNPTDNGLYTLWDNNGSFAVLNAVLTSPQPTTLTLSNDAATTSVTISSAGTVTLTNGLTADNVTANGDINAAGDLNVDGQLTVDPGSIVVESGSISTSGVEITANDISATNGAVTCKNPIFTGKTITTPGTVGARTINAVSGSVNFGSSDSSLVVTNSLVNTNSIIFVSKGTAGSHRLGAVVPAAGSFTIYMDTAHSGECRVNFLVTN
jgi:hypothetical protein